MNIFETLKRSFYSEREANFELNQSKNFSQDTPEPLVQEDGIIPASDTSSFTLGQSIEYLVSEKRKLTNMWRDMAFTPEVDEAIQEILNEAFVFDESGDLPFELDLEDMEISDEIKTKILEAFEKMLKVLDFRMKGDQLFRQWYIDGSLAMEVIYNNKNFSNGIRVVKILPPHHFYRVKDPETKKERFFLDTRPVNDMNNLSLVGMYQQSSIKYIPEQITYIDSGVYSKDKLFPISHLNKSAKVVNNLNMIEESLLVYRFTRSPARNAIYVDTGRLPKAKAEQYLQTLILKHRNKTNFNLESGLIENRKKSIPMQEDIWFAVNAEGRGTKIEPLQGGNVDISEIADLDYFIRKLWRALNVPSNRRDPESRGGGMNFQNQETENEEIKFYKFVLNLRKRFIQMFVDLLKKELIVTKVFSLDDWDEIEQNVKFKFKNNNDFALNKKLANIDGLVQVASNALQLVEGGIVTNGWIKREIMNFTDDELKQMDAERKKEEAEMPKDEGDGYSR